MEKNQIIMELEFSEYEALRQEVTANAGIIADVFTIKYYSSSRNPRIWHSEGTGNGGGYR